LNSTLFAVVIRELVLSVTSEPMFPRLRYSALVSDVTTWNSVFTVTEDGVYWPVNMMFTPTYIWVIAHFNTVLNVRLSLQWFLTFRFPLKMRDNLGDGMVIKLLLKLIGYEDGAGQERDILQL